MRVLSLLDPMERRLDFYVILSISVISLVIFTSCGPGDKKTEIEIAIHKAVDAAAANDVEEFMTFIDYDYLDPEERTKQDIREKVDAHLNRFRVIAINILNIKTVEKTNDSATVIVEVNFSHGLGRMLTKIIRSAGESYRFHLQMTRRGKGWVTAAAEWEWMSIEDLYPESIRVLRELFPGTF